MTLQSRLRLAVGTAGLIVALLACAPRPEPVSATSAMAGVEAVIERQVGQGFSGTVLVGQGDHILFNRAYGAVRGVPMRPATRYWISSTGKQFVSAAVLLLSEQGRLSLDDPIARFWPDAPADKRSISVRQLLSHTSRLPQGYVGEHARSSAEAVRAILAVPLAPPGGTGFIYANDNYQLAAALVEQLSGLGLRDFERRHFFAPLKMRDTGIAAGPAGIAPTRDPTPARLLEAQWGIGGHYASAPDLFKWYRALVTGRVLGPPSVATLMTPVVPIGEGQAALGWFVGTTAAGTRRVFTRGNDDFGANSLIYAYPDRDLVIVILSHAGQAADGTSHSRALLAKLESALRL